MATTIRTTYKTNGKGEGQILAKGGGKQRTAPYDHERGVRDNHRHAMIRLANVLDRPTFPRTEVMEQDNGRATFTLS